MLNKNKVKLTPSSWSCFGNHERENITLVANGFVYVVLKDLEKFKSV